MPARQPAGFGTTSTHRLTFGFVTGAEGGPVAVSTLDVTALLSDPIKAKAAQDLAMILVEQEIALLDADESQPEPQKLLPGPMEKDQQGHWKL